MSSFNQTEGVILRVISFRDYDQIFSLFTPHKGLIKLIAKGSRRQSRSRKNHCNLTPLLGVQVVYREKNSEIFECEESHLMEPYHFLRRKLSDLEIACDLIQLIDFSQLLGKPAPSLYSLLCFFLNRIPQLAEPQIISTCFRVKILKHEGLIGFPLACKVCSKPLLHQASLSEGFWFCNKHVKHRDLFFTEEENQFLLKLGHCNHFQDIANSQASSEFHVKIKQLFMKILQR